MAGRPPLLLVATTADAERLRGALMLGCAEAALGGAVRLFVALDAVRLLGPHVVAPRDDEHAAAGLPGLAALLADALDLGIAVVACQSGLVLAGMDADMLDGRIAVGGTVGVLAATDGQERLLLA